MGSGSNCPVRKPKGFPLRKKTGSTGSGNESGLIQIIFPPSPPPLKNNKISGEDKKKL